MTKLFTWLLCLGLCVPAIAQDRWDKPIPIHEDYVLTGVHVVTKPGTIIEDAKIWISKGRIKQIGQFETPMTVEEIKADSMYAYAGFIVGHSYTGIPTPKKDENAKGPDRPGTPTDKQAGILPDRSAAELYDPSDKSVTAMRKQGFTVSHSVPRGKSLPGQGAVVLLGEGSKEQMILAERTSLNSSLTGSGRMYPATVIGVMAKYRDLFRKAELALKHETMFSSGLSNERPQYAPSITGLYPVIRGDQPVFFSAGSALSARRIGQLQADIGFDLVLSDVKESWLLEDMLKDYSGPLFLSTDLPKEIKEDKKKATDKKTGEQEAFEKRKMESYEKHLSQASSIHQMNKSFGFSAISGQDKDILKNIRRMVASGLPADVALEALTTTPAQVLGMSKHMGSLAQGKMANIVLSDKPIFEEKSEITYVFVEGEKYDFVSNKKDKKKGKVEGDAALAIGTWTYSAEVPGQTVSGTMEITADGDSLSGTITSDDDGVDTDLEGVALDGETLTAAFEIDQDGFTMNISLELTIDGDDFSGTMTAGQFGQFPITGSRKPE